MNSKIIHSGVVDSVADGVVSVRITQTSACAVCKVAGHCGASEAKEKIVSIACRNATDYRQGQAVMVSTSRQSAINALSLAFIVPFIGMVATLIIMLNLTGKEPLAALAALATLATYYLLLWLSNSVVSRKVQFYIES